MRQRPLYNLRLFSKTTISFLWHVMFYFCFLQIPLFQRGGTIIATKQRIRRCSALMHNDPYTLTLALSPKVRRDSCIVNFKHVTEALYHWETKQTNHYNQGLSLLVFKKLYLMYYIKIILNQRKAEHNLSSAAGSLNQDHLQTTLNLD